MLRGFTINVGWIFINVKKYNMQQKKTVYIRLFNLKGFKWVVKLLTIICKFLILFNKLLLIITQNFPFFSLCLCKITQTLYLANNLQI